MSLRYKLQRPQGIKRIVHRIQKNLLLQKMMDITTLRYNTPLSKYTSQLKYLLFAV